MKKLYTFMLGLLATAMSYAQADAVYVFTNAAGEEIADGSTVTVNTVEEDEFDGTLMMPCGLSIKNVSELGPEVCQTGMTINITEMPNGQLKHCYPSSCNYYKAVGVQKCEGNTPVLKGKSKQVLSEWLPTAYGTCSVTYTVERYSYDSATRKYTFIAKGPSVTVNYVYNDPAAIKEVGSNKAQGKMYNLQGQQVDDSYKGVVIKDGKKMMK